LNERQSDPAQSWKHGAKECGASARSLRRPTCEAYAAAGKVAKDFGCTNLKVREMLPLPASRTARRPRMLPALAGALIPFP
jgi:hypothetical protein